MALFQQKEEAKSKPKAKKAVAKKEKKATPEVRDAAVAYDVLVEPWITEKSHAAIAQNKYTFKVTTKASKKSVTKAVEGIYGVSVESVRMVTVHPKKKNYGRYVGEKSGFKKATVELKKGDKIEFFKTA